MNQEELRKECRFLKWDKGISFKEMAKATNMSEYSFYNFISGRKANLSHKAIYKLTNFIKEMK